MHYILKSRQRSWEGRQFWDGAAKIYFSLDEVLSAIQSRGEITVTISIVPISEAKERRLIAQGRARV